MAEKPRNTIHQTVEAFLDTHPDLESSEILVSDEAPKDVEFETIFDGDTRYITIDGEPFKVTVMGRA